MREQLPLSTAVICYNDEIAYHLIKYLTDSGKKIPQDIAVASFDNSYYSRISPVPITSLWHKTRRMGTEAAGLLLSILQGKNAHSLVLPWELSERMST
jgi:GntR family transcriptional regulator of arabinose operon